MNAFMWLYTVSLQYFYLKVYPNKVDWIDHMLKAKFSIQ